MAPQNLPTRPLQRHRAVAAKLTILACFASCLLAVPAGAVEITEFPIEAGGGANYITTGPDGNLWFTDGLLNKIGRITTSGQVTEFDVGITPNAGLAGIASGPDGNLWFTERTGDKIGRITPQGIVTEFSAGLTGTPDIYGITSGPGNKMWFTETFAQRIGTIDPFTGAITEIPTPAGVNTKIVAGPEGDLWYTDVEHALISRMSSAGAVSQFGPLSSIACGVYTPPCPYPESIVVGPDGNLWFDEARGDALGRISTSGAITEYSAGLSYGAAAADLTPGPDGNVWFTELVGDQVGRITPSGVITEYHAGISAGAEPFGITLGPDGNLWFAERTSGKIARLIPDVPPVVATGDPSAIASNAAIVTGTVRSRGADTHYTFEFGPSQSYGATTATGDNGTGDAAQAVDGGMTGLSPSTAYHYRLVASNASGVSYGADHVLTTAPGPPTFSVKPFQMYFSGYRRPGHRLRLSRIIVILVKRGERVDYSCHRCSGRPRHASRVATGSKLAFKLRNLEISTHSSLLISVTAPDGSRRTRTYRFDLRRAQDVLHGEQCFAPSTRTAVSCRGS